jgi:uncharacterized protein (DUF488 family)
MKGKKMWIKGQKDNILINLNNIADITYRKKDSAVVCYTAEGVGIVIFTGDPAQCDRILKELEAVVSIVYHTK